MKKVLLAVTLAVGLFAQSSTQPGAAKKTKEYSVTEIRNPATALVSYHVAKPHTVKAHMFQLKVSPYASQPFNKRSKGGGIRLTVNTTLAGALVYSNLAWTNAGILVVVDGERLLNLGGSEWTSGVSEETVINNPALLHAIAGGKDVYITLDLFDDGTFSFKLTQQQIDDCGLIAAKYDQLSGN